MTWPTPIPMPAFGEADLANCEREQLHLAGSIQPHGALLVLDDGASVVLQASANAAAFLGLEGAPLVGRPVASLPGTLAGRIKAHAEDPLHRRGLALQGRMGASDVDLDAVLHRPPEGGLVVEFELASEPIALRRQIDPAMQAILNAPALKALSEETARLMKQMTGYDRVMVYRFDEFGHGEVYAEQREDHLEAFLGNRYPASDIPRIARQLYLRNRVRLLVDVEYDPVPIVPRLSPDSGRELDMSMCTLRSMSPIHLQYLKNMGVRATLVISLVVGGDLWGLIACHHYTPKFVPFEARMLGELIAELVSTRIAALECFQQTQSELLIRRLEQRMVDAIGRDGDWRMALFDGPQTLLQAVDAAGVALVYEGQIQGAGDLPATAKIREIVGWLDTRPRDPVIATASLGQDEAGFAPLAATATGILATPISATPGEYLVWFRPERVRTVIWGGDPTKPAIVGTDPRQLSPRLSFAQWHERVEGTSDPWTPADHTTAKLIAGTIADMVLQFRSVRMLIAQDQLETLSRQVRLSAQPMVVANAGGRVLITNEAFESLLRRGQRSLLLLEDLPQFFTEPMNLRRRIEDLMQLDRSWRGEVAISAIDGAATPLMLRAEPVYASLDRKLGYILHFDEIAGRKAAERARRNFQDGMIDRRLLQTARLDLAEDRDYQSVLATVVENAQLAALEITYGVEAERMPRLLEAVRSSVARSAELLEDLIGRANGAGA